MISGAAVTTVEGRFFRIERAGARGLALARGAPDRPPARFNRTGENALYLSPDEASAWIAVRGVWSPEDPGLCIVAYEIGAARVLDLRHPACAALYETARQPWRAALAEGREPPSWQVAEQVRAEGLDGLIDPSRRAPGCWALTLLAWNEAGAPEVARITP